MSSRITSGIGMNTGTDTHFLFARSSTRTFGGSNANKLDSLWLPAICTEKNLVVSLAAPGVSAHWIAVGGGEVFAAEYINDQPRRLQLATPTC